MAEFGANETGSWPNNAAWSALKDETIHVDDRDVKMITVNCGKLKVPSGRLICADPFVEMSANGRFVVIPPGEYDVIVTVADVSAELDGSHLREAYATLVIDPASVEVSRKCLDMQEGEDSNPPVIPNPTSDKGPDDCDGFGVDAGTACFVDREAVQEGMPDPSTWYDEVFSGVVNEGEVSWFDQMDDPELIQKGIANITMPKTQVGNNIVIFHSGWGDGFYPVVGGFDKDNKLISVHIDFFVVPVDD